ncbi:type IV pilin biogenesis protein [Posidoniimonas polymericola]|uniref:Type IV pilin biogenesis protein n=1 Tax=Posidoniimonas polymericola TaxID=2528002 RepID=A0A5C5YHS1_9BACT|nr:type II secretion system F family protein [Posidoniimonas polymericola]TWT74511.1 type IV pilin biogenesis protein [Posidoniimonas polymericola]
MFYPILVLLSLVAVAGVLTRFALRLAYGARGPDTGDDLYSIINLLSWVAIVVGATAFSLLNLLFGVLLATMIGIALLEYTQSRRRVQRHAAWGILNQAARHGHNVAEMVKLQQSRFSGVARRELDGFAWQVTQGEPLPMAVAIWRRAFPREAQGFAALGKDDGVLAIEPNDASQQALDPSPGWSDNLGYLVWVVISGMAVAAFMTVWIAPSYQQIFVDFSIDLPDSTEAFFAITNGPLPVLLVVALPLLVLLLVSVFFFYLTDVPILQAVTDRLMFSRHRAQLLRLLALAAERDQPFAKTLQHLGLGQPRFPVGCFDRPLRRALRSAASGANWKDALASAGLLKRSELSLITAAEAAQNLPWALRALAERLINRSVARWESIRSITTVIGTLLVGLLVLWFCVAMFSPLVVLIESLS